jgi:hypothetical protein
MTLLIMLKHKLQSDENQLLWYAMLPPNIWQNPIKGHD